MAWAISGAYTEPATAELCNVKSTDNNVETLERTIEHLKDNQVNIASTNVRIGKSLKFDPQREIFPGESTANAMLTREYRAPFVVPGSADKV